MIRENAGSCLSSTRLLLYPARHRSLSERSIRKLFGRSGLQITVTVSPTRCLGLYLLRMRNVCIFPVALSRHTAFTYHWLPHMVASSCTCATVARMGLSRFLLCRLMKPMMELIRSSTTMTPTRTSMPSRSSENIHSKTSCDLHICESKRDDPGKNSAVLPSCLEKFH